MKHSIDCIDFKPRRKTLVGFATIFIREIKLVIRDVALHDKHGSRWAALPSRPWIKDGALVTDESGKPQYSPSSSSKAGRPATPSRPPSGARCSQEIPPSAAP